MLEQHRPYADEGEVETTFREIRSSLERIEAQTTKTNGRVRALELYKAFVTGALAIIGLLLGAILTILTSGALK